ncbi:MULTISPECIES: DUF58 domain-containing protein [Arthrobacter]|uniref:DUF58 domain-containing protein n=1 Tax=Arthrobacter TaxID=1663 RepID=UPI0028F73BBE|nr:DUF58 domain-containing protein [Arthrobacter sp. lap29]
MSLFQLLRPRGWLLFACAVLSLILASILGRRDVLTLAVFCFMLPATAYASLHFFKSGFSLHRHISPLLGRVGEPVEVSLEVRGHNPGGSQSQLVEALPTTFAQVPTFSHPQAGIPRASSSNYHYSLLPRHRGVFTIGPLLCTFTDPFGVASLRRGIDHGDRLTIAPAALELPAISVSEGHGQDGSQSTSELARSHQDDLMTRDYRYGDPLRRVHWALTARQGRLMVRGEEPVTTPEAILILDRRALAFGPSVPSAPAPPAAPTAPAPPTNKSLRTATRAAQDLPELATTAAFEEAIVATASIAAHLLERAFTLTLLDHLGAPALLTSASAAEPSRAEYSGGEGSYAVAAGLAAVELAGPGETTLAATLAHRLHDRERRGPVIAVMGALSEAEATLLAGNAEGTQSSYALLVCATATDAEPAAQILRRAGWHAAPVTPATTLWQAWANLDAHHGGGKGRS